MDICIGLTVLGVLAWGAVAFLRFLWRLVTRQQPEAAQLPLTASSARWGEKEIVAQYNGPCSECSHRIVPGQQIFWNKQTKGTRHVDCEAARRDHEARELERKKVQETEAFFKLLDRLNNAKGAAGRQSVLARAEDQIVTPELRLHLLLEASKLETDAVLEKVEGLKSKVVKRRRLEEALAALRNDPVPDEMQAQQIAWLEEALQSLDAEAVLKA